MGASWSPCCLTPVGQCKVYCGLTQKPRSDWVISESVYRRPLFLGVACQGRLLSASPSLAHSSPNPQVCALPWVPAVPLLRCGFASLAPLASQVLLVFSSPVRCPNVPNSCIGGSGTTTKRVRTTISSQTSRCSTPLLLLWLLRMQSFLEPLALSLWGIAALSVFQLFVHCLPGRSSPLGRLLRLPTSGLPRSAVCPIAFVGSACGSINWRPWNSRKGRSPRRAGLKPARSWCLWSMLLLHMPLQVWAVPPSYRAAIQACQTLVEALPNHLETAIDPRTPPEPQGSFDPHRNNAWPMPPPVILTHQTPEQPVGALRWHRGLRIDPGEQASPWLGVILHCPYYQQQEWAIQCDRTLGVSGLLDQLTSHTEDAFHFGMDTVAAINPQRHNGYAMFIKFSSALDSHPDGGQVAVMLDLSHVGGHYHAVVLPALITQQLLCDLVDGQIFCPAEQTTMYIATDREPLNPRSQVKLQHGDVITVVEHGGAPPFLHLLEELFEPECEWGALEHIPRRILTPAVRVLHAERHFTLVGYHFPLLSVSEAISQVIGTDLDTLSVATSWHFGDLDDAGAPCDRCVSFCILPRCSRLAVSSFRVVFVFCDLRPLGMHPQCLCTHSYHLHVPTIAGLLGIRQPRDVALKVDGGIQAGDEILVDGQSCLTFYFCPDLIDLEASSSEPSAGSEPDDRPTDTASRSYTGHSDSESASSSGATRSPDTNRSSASPPIGDNPQECQDHPALSYASRMCKAYAQVAPATLGLPALHFDREHSCAFGACGAHPRKSRFWCSPSAWGLVNPPCTCCLYWVFDQPLPASLPCHSQLPWFQLVLPDALCDEATRAGPKLSGFAGFVQAKQPEDAGIRSDHGVVLPDILDRVPAPPGPRDGPLFPIDAGRIAQDIAFGRMLADDPWIHAMFLVMPPDTVAEALGVPLQAPCTVQDALAAVAQVRDEAASLLYPELFVAEPQPSRLFACLIAAPAWAQHLCVILADTRGVNGALFAVATSGRLNRESLLLAAGLPVSDQLHVYCGTSLQPLAPWQLVDLISGMTVTFCPVHLPAPRRALLEDMLQSTLMWDPDADIPSPGGIHFLLLTDGMPTLFTLQPQRGRHYRADISRALQCDEQDLTIQQSTPRQQDVLFRGHHVRAVVVATTTISRIPVPPGLLLPSQFLLFLDCRPIYLSFQWLLLSSPELPVQSLVDRYAPRCPEGFIVSVKGAEIENRDTGAVFRFRSSQTLRIEFVQDNLGDTDSGASSSSGSSDDPADEDLPEVNATRPHHRAPSPDRSRSPRQHTEHGPRTATDGADHPATLSRPGRAVRPCSPGVTPCCVFPVGFPAELIMFQLSSASNATDIAEAVQISRSGPSALDCGYLHLVTSLPGQDCLCFVAVPPWAHRQCVVCIDTLALDGYIYAARAPSVVDVFSALAAAGLPLRTEADIYIDDSQVPLSDGQEAALSPGSLLRFAHKGHAPPVDQLGADFVCRLIAGNNAPPRSAASGTDTVTLLVHDEDQLLYYGAEDADFLDDVAALFGGDVQHLQTATAAPTPIDVAFQGRLCNTAMACHFQPTPAREDFDMLVLLDCRRLLGGWVTSHAPGGLFDVGRHLDAFAVIAPVGWQPVCEGCADPLQPMPAFAGQIFIFRLGPDASPASSSTGAETVRVQGACDPSSRESGNATKAANPAASRSLSPATTQVPGGAAPSVGPPCVQCVLVWGSWHVRILPASLRQRIPSCLCCFSGPPGHIILAVGRPSPVLCTGRLFGEPLRAPTVAGGATDLHPLKLSFCSLMWRLAGPLFLLGLIHVLDRYLLQPAHFEAPPPDCQ